MYQSNAVWAVSHSTVLELFCTSAYSSHLFRKLLNLQSYSLELSSFPKTFSSLLFSPHGKVLKFINKLFRGFSWNLPLVMHCVFSKAHVILPKFQMCPRLEKGGSVFLLILSPFLPIFIFFFIRIGICLFIPPSLERELSEDRYGLRPSAEPVPMWVDGLSFIQR